MTKSAVLQYLPLRVITKYILFYTFNSVTHLNHQVFAAAAEALQHAQEQVSRFHQVLEVRLRLFGFIILS